MKPMTFHTPRDNQGQTVIESYAPWGDKVYMRRHDRSDGEITYYVSDAPYGDEGDYWNEAPVIAVWQEIFKSDLPTEEYPS